MTQEDLAKALAAPGLPPVVAMTVSRWERGQRAPSRRHRRRLADVLGGMPVDYEEDDLGLAPGVSAPTVQQPGSGAPHTAVSRAELEQMKEDVVVVAANLAAQEFEQPNWRPHLALYAALVGRLLAGEVIYYDEVARLLDITQAASEWRMETLGHDDIAAARARWKDLLSRLAKDAPRRPPGP
jgi:transcriptional regulator with XRE-family HTH domain